LAKNSLWKKRNPFIRSVVHRIAGIWKKALADAVFQKLKQDGLKVERLDSLDVRPLFPETGFAPDDVNRHVKRAGHLCSMLEKNGIIVVASFVSPYRGSRIFARQRSVNFVEVYMKSTVEACEKRDEKGHYQKARSGEYRYFPGVGVKYEEPVHPELVIDVDHISSDTAAQTIINYLKKNIINAK